MKAAKQTATDQDGEDESCEKHAIGPKRIVTPYIISLFDTMEVSIVKSNQ